MLKKRFLPAMVLVLGLAVIGCETSTDEPDNISGYTFEFRVENGTGGLGSNITQFEIFNGPNTSSKVLSTGIINLPPGQVSDVYRVAGFTDRDGSDKRIYGVRITLDDGSTQFGYSSATNGSKILAVTTGFAFGFSSGTW